MVFDFQRQGDSVITNEEQPMTYGMINLYQEAFSGILLYFKNRKAWVLQLKF